MSDICEWWAALSPQVQAAIIQVGGTLLTAVVGLVILGIQLRSQSTQSRETIAENERRKIKAQMYDEAVLVSRAMSDAAITLSTKLRTMAMDITVASAAASVNLHYNLPVARFPGLMKLYEEFSDAALKFVFFLEHRQFIDPRLIVFRTAISTVLHDTRNLMYGQFPAHVMPSLPTENPAGGLFLYTPPSEAQAEAIGALSDKFMDSLGDATNYADDFLVDLQNLLVGDLFKNPVAHRVPLDPSCKVVTIQDAVALEEWFATSTDWGIEKARVEAETKKRFEPAKTETA